MHVLVARCTHPFRQAWLYFLEKAEILGIWDLQGVPHREQVLFFKIFSDKNFLIQDFV